MNATNVRHDAEAHLQANWAGAEHELAGQLEEQLVMLAVLHGFPNTSTRCPVIRTVPRGSAGPLLLRLTSSHGMDFHCERA